jgi:hypothetical protein
MRNENEKSAEYSRICPFCDDEFVTTNPQKRYCCERHQRNAAKARYRTRHTEPATCKGCDTSFEADHYWRSSAGLLLSSVPVRNPERRVPETSRRSAWCDRSESRESLVAYSDIPAASRACCRHKESGACGKLPADSMNISPAFAETLLAMVGIVGHHARRMAIALLWSLAVWLALFDLTLLLLIR